MSWGLPFPVGCRVRSAAFHPAGLVGHVVCLDDRGRWVSFDGRASWLFALSELERVPGADPGCPEVAAFLASFEKEVPDASLD